MSIRITIFSLYLLILASLPCTDQNTCFDEKRNGIENIHQANHGHSASETDHCSPFCICSCCAATVQLTIAGIALLPSFSHNMQQVVTPYIEKHLPDNLYSIWQPPRLA